MERLVPGALGTSLIASEAVEDGDGFGVEEIGGTAIGDLGLDAAETVQVPGGVDEFVEGDGFDGSLGVEFGEFLSVLGQGHEAVDGYFSARLEGQLLVAASRLGYVREVWVDSGDGSFLGQFTRAVPP